MKNDQLITNASNLANYQAVNCNGHELGIVDGLITTDHPKKTFLVLSTHHKDLFGNVKYAVPYDLCDIDDKNKTVWLNVDKSEMEFLYKLCDLYDKKYTYWNDDIDRCFNIHETIPLKPHHQSMDC